jgi:ABC-type nitrate/sulfonate/bicarbonate transport system substrate-binding protein
MLNFKRRSQFVAFILLVFVVVVSFGIGCQPQKPISPPEKITIAYSTTFNSIFINIAFVNGYFKQEGLEAEPQIYPFGKPALQAVIEGRADIATVADTPVMFAIMNGKKVVIIASMGTTNRNTAIIARQDRGITAPSDLKGKRIGVTVGTAGDFFAEVLLKANGIDRKEVTIIDMTPDKMAAALTTGKIDGASVWNPALTKLQSILGDKGHTFYGEAYYTETYCAATTKAFVEEHAEAIKKFLRAIIKAEVFVREHSEDARRLTSEFLKTDRAILDKIWDIYHFQVTLDQALLVELEDQTRWAIKNGLAAKHDMPNYLDFIYMDGLQVVKPEAVRIIR